VAVKNKVKAIAPSEATHANTIIKIKILGDTLNPWLKIE
jgi:hypothetical protein